MEGLVKLYLMFKVVPKMIELGLGLIMGLIVIVCLIYYVIANRR